MPTFSLIPHPDHPPHKVNQIGVNVAMNAKGGLWLEFAVGGADLLILPELREPARFDGLWRTTCFELFFKPNDGDAYFEFNFSPSFQWAAYHFDQYRTGMRVLAADDPEIEVSLNANPWFFLAAELWPATLAASHGTIGLAAVIEELNGTKSYWALAHAPGPPDFHNPACFTVTLPPPPRP